MFNIVWKTDKFGYTKSEPKCSLSKLYQSKYNKKLFIYECLSSSKVFNIIIYFHITFFTYSWGKQMFMRGALESPCKSANIIFFWTFVLRQIRLKEQCVLQGFFLVPPPPPNLTKSQALTKTKWPIAPPKFPTNEA